MKLGGTHASQHAGVSVSDPGAYDHEHDQDEDE